MTDQVENTEINLDSPEYYINRELSQIDFQWRVFDEARDPRNPLLERVRFLAIVDSNLDEFFMTRVGGIRMQRDAGIVELPADGMTPARQLAAIRKETQKLLEECRRYLHDDLQPLLSDAGIRLMT